MNRFINSIQPLRLTLDNYYIFLLRLKTRENAALLTLESGSPKCSISGS